MLPCDRLTYGRSLVRRAQRVECSGTNRYHDDRTYIFDPRVAILSPIQTPDPQSSTDAIRRVALLISSGEAVDEHTGRAVALRKLSHAIFRNNGSIRGYERTLFNAEPGTPLFRGVTHVEYVEENLNGYWVGTGYLCDGNHYAGTHAQHKAINFYGFENPWGWAMPYKLLHRARITEPKPIESISLDRFIAKVTAIHNVDSDVLKAIYDTDEIGYRAVLLGFDVIYDRTEDHYIVYNADSLICCEDFTPWALGIQENAPVDTQQAAYQRINPSARRSPMDSGTPFAIQYLRARSRAKALFQEAAP